jgi:hypothetical protein
MRMRGSSHLEKEMYEAAVTYSKIAEVQDSNAKLECGHVREVKSPEVGQAVYCHECTEAKRRKEGI